MSYLRNNRHTYQPERCMNCDQLPEFDWIDISTYTEDLYVPGRHWCRTPGCVYTPPPSPSELAERGRRSLQKVRDVWDEVFS